MRFRPLWIAVPACAAAGAMSLSFVAAQEAPPKATPKPVQLKPTLPDTRAANSMFGPPPTASGVTPAANAEPAPPLFFPNASPPPKTVPLTPAPAALPPGMPPPRITVESSTEPKPLPIVAPAPAMPVISTPPPAAPAPTPPAMMPIISAPVTPAPAAPTVPSGPQPLVPTTTPPVTTPAKPMPMPMTMAFPNLQLTPKQSPSVVIECHAPESISVGQSFDYILVVKNAGSSAVANVRLEDELPAGAKFLASEPAAEQNGDRLAWNIGLLDANAEKRIRITMKPGDEGELRSRAMVSFTAAAEARIKVTRPRIAMALTGQESARVGDEVPFQIRVTNTGSGPAVNLLVKAKLSDGLHHPAGSQIEAGIDRLPPGETKTITLRATATKSGSHACSIIALGDGVTAETVASNVAVVEPLLAAKVVGPAKCLVRSEPEFKIELSNPGSAATDPVQVWAIVPEGFDFVQATDGGTFQPGNRTVLWHMPAFAAGSRRTAAVKLKATSASAATVKVIAQSAPAPETGVVPAGGRLPSTRVIEAKSETAIKCEGVPALRFEVVDVEDPVEVGKEAIYDIRVVNQGTAHCTNVSVGVTLADGTVTAGASGPTTARGQGQQITFEPLPNLAVKGEAVFRVKVRGVQPGDMKLRVQLSCDEIRTPTTKEENTRFIKD